MSPSAPDTAPTGDIVTQQSGPAFSLPAVDAALAEYRAALVEEQQVLTSEFRKGVPANTLVRRRAVDIDALLAQMWCRFKLDTAQSLALVAVGGYGRGELHPGSDVDLLLLLGNEPNDLFTGYIQDFVTFLWDLGLDVGHSVRTVEQCVVEAENDVTVVTNLMEARLLQGPDALFQSMRKSVGRDSIWPRRRFFEAKWQEQVSRHHKFNDTAYNLEPNVKEGPGGLRDIQTVGWVAKRHFGADTLDQLVTHEFLTESEYQSLTDGQDFLWQVRFALHMLSGRREDRLLFEYQRSLANELGYRDSDHNLAVEKFMKRYYRTIMELSRLNEMLLELFQEDILLADNPAEVVPISRRFQERNGFLEVVDDGVFKRHPFALLELFLVLQQHPDVKGVRATTIRLVRDHRYLIDDSFRNDIRAKSLFLEIIRQSRGITHELRRMHRYGVLEAYLPVFETIVGQMQYDLFHAYTVDEHSLFVVRNLRSFAMPERYHEFPLCSAVFQRIPKPELLYLAGLFHDIAKGRGGDHSKLGAQDALTFCLQHGMSEYDGRLVAWLVENHLRLSTTAQRQDIYDPEVINAFAVEIGDQTHLDYLYLLTVADIRATNPTLWNDWKDALLRDLFELTRRALRQGLERPIDGLELVQEKRDATLQLLGPEASRDARVEGLWRSLGDEYFLRATPDEIAWHTRAMVECARRDLPLVLVRKGRAGTEIFIYMPDQDYLFAATTSILDGLGLTILHASIITAANNMTLDSYVVMEESGEPIADRDRERTIRDALGEQLRRPGEAALPVNRLPRRQLKHFPIPTRVGIRTEEGRDRTILEVVCGDRPGLLSRIAWALTTCNVRLQHAKVATFGEKAEDFFYVSDRSNRSVDEDQTRCLEETIVTALEDEKET